MARNRSKKAIVSLLFGDALKAARKNVGLSQVELSRRIEKSDATISRYESGLEFPPKTTLEAIEREVKASLQQEWITVKPEWEKLKADKAKEKKSAPAESQGKRAEKPKPITPPQQIAALVAHINEIKGQNFTRAETENLESVLLDTLNYLRNKKKEPNSKTPTVGFGKRTLTSEDQGVPKRKNRP
jgi:transcriptional regulator with XRE-family HTH domain